MNLPTLPPLEPLVNPCPRCWKIGNYYTAAEVQNPETWPQVGDLIVCCACRALLVVAAMDDVRPQCRLSTPEERARIGFR